jgi:two-component system sensor histidine kinase/response regulator
VIDRTRSVSRWVVVSVVALTCAIATWAAYVFARGYEDYARQEAFDVQVTQANHGLETRIQAYLELLHGGRGLFQAAETDDTSAVRVDRDDWTEFVTALALDQRHPGTAALGFIRRVRGEELPQFETYLQAYSPAGIYPTGAREDYFVIDYVEPQSAAGAVGFDVGTDPGQREALLRARDTNAPAATRRLHLPNDPADQPAILFVIPVFLRGRPVDTVEARRDGLVGFVYAALFVEGIVRDVLGADQTLALTAQIHEIGPTGAETTLWASPEFEQRIPGLTQEETLEVGGRRWRVEYGALREPTQSSRQPLIVLIAGVLVTSLFASLVYTLTGANERALRLAADMTLDLREREAQLAIARDQALAGSRAKSEFLASVSHEIRTPLNAVLGTADLLATTALSEEQRRYVEVCRSAGNYLLALLNHVLDLSKVEAGKLEVEQIDFELADVVDQCADIIGPRARARGLELIFRVAPEIPGGLVGDHLRLGQVLVNLLNNATKFTHQGSITLVVSRDPANREVARFSVTDTGIGIPNDKLEAVFDEFTQVDASTTRQYGGTGLGLAITRRLVQLMGGRIWAESEMGRGSTFHFTLPIRVSRQRARGRVADPLPLGVRVLAIDAYATNRDVLTETLLAAGVEVTVASDVAHAPEVIDRFDCLISDVRMRGELVARYGATPPLILLAPLADRPLEAGGVHFLDKPIRPAQVVETVRRVVTPHANIEAPAAQPHSADPLAPTRVRLLIAEDNVDNRMILSAYLRTEPIDAVFAEDGEIAVQRFSEVSWDLILMDMQMPNKDGLAATREIRELEVSRGVPRTPIVALTAHAFAQERNQMLDAGCDDVASKPIRKDALLRLIQKHAQPKVKVDVRPPVETLAVLAAPATVPPNPPREQGVTDGTASKKEFGTVGRWPTFTPAEPLEPPPPIAAQTRPTDTVRVAQIPAFYDLTKTYLEKQRAQAPKIRELLMANDLTQIAFVAHGLKGSGGSFGFPEITTFGGAMEQAAKQGDAAAVAAALDRLEQYLTRVELVRDE